MERHTCFEILCLLNPEAVVAMVLSFAFHVVDPLFSSFFVRYDGASSYSSAYLFCYKLFLSFIPHFRSRPLSRFIIAFFRSNRTQIPKKRNRRHRCRPTIPCPAHCYLGKIFSAAYPLHPHPNPFPSLQIQPGQVFCKMRRVKIAILAFRASRTQDVIRCCSVHRRFYRSY